MKKNLLTSLSISQLAKSEIIYILIIIAIWVIMTILVNPVGNFPLNDDWAFGQAVKSLVEKGEFKLSDWGAMNLFSQVWWGALFSLPFGFSFTALRLSTLSLGLIGVLATYGLLRETNSNPKIALLGALLILVNPIYFSLSNTFMTDVPFFTFATLSLFFLIRGLKYDSILEISIGIIISCIALLIRQLGIVIFLGFGCAYIFKKGLSIKNIIQGFSPSVLGFGLQFFYQKWLSYTDRLPASFGLQIKNLSKIFSISFDQTLLHFVQNSQIALIYLGLFSVIVQRKCNSY
jgi:4-amino-4-deoxy-L-arabinose transferase-like glycosyltransferase